MIRFITQDTSLGWAGKMGMAVIAYLSPVRDVILFMILLVAIDLITGIWASYKKHKAKKENIRWFSSNRLSRSVSKFIIYPLAIVLTFHFQELFGFHDYNIINFVAGFICFVELVSFFENCYHITNEPIFMKIVKIFKDKLTKKVSEVNSSIKDL